MVIIFFALLILDLALLIYSMHCILQCSEFKKWPTMLTILLMVMLFIPSIGFLTSLGVIIYYHLSCGANAQAPAQGAIQQGQGGAIPQVQGNAFEFY